MIKAIFFDLYNTLITYDPPREETQIRILRNHGMSVTKKAMSLAIKAGDEYFYSENSRSLVKERTPEEQNAFWYNYEAILLREAGINEPSSNLVYDILRELDGVKYKMAPYSDAIPTFKALKNGGYKLGIISNIDRDINPMCEEMGFSPFLDLILTSKETGLYKPSPEIFHLACTKTDVTPAQTIYVGDQYQIDVVGATAAGLTGVLVDRDSLSDEEQLEGYSVSSLLELPELAATIIPA